MTAAAASMFVVTLDLANRQIDTTRRHARWADVLLPKLPLAVLKVVTVFFLKRGTQILQRDALIFKGAAAEVAELVEHSYPDAGCFGRYDDSIAALEKLGNEINTMHSIMLRSKFDSARVQAAARGFASAAATLYESIRDLRWELMELEGNNSPINEGYAATSPEELDKVFERILSE